MTNGMDGAGGRFETLDSALTVFALANGVDLTKSDGERRLEWFSEGLERGVVIAAEDEGFSLRSRAWRTSEPHRPSETEVARGLSVAEVRSTLSDAIDAANALAAPRKADPPDR